VPAQPATGNMHHQKQENHHCGDQPDPPHPARRAAARWLVRLDMGTFAGWLDHRRVFLVSLRQVGMAKVGQPLYFADGNWPRRSATGSAIGLGIPEARVFSSGNIALNFSESFSLFDSRHRLIASTSCSTPRQNLWKSSPQLVCILEMLCAKAQFHPGTMSNANNAVAANLDVHRFGTAVV
jgi:hypothetical protein